MSWSWALSQCGLDYDTSCTRMVLGPVLYQRLFNTFIILLLHSSNMHVTLMDIHIMQRHNIKAVFANGYTTANVHS